MGSPRRFNVVTIVLLGGVAAGGYWLWKFFPVYYTAWQVDTALADGVARTYQLQPLAEPERARSMRELEQATRDKVVALGVDDPELALRIEVADRKAIATCDYTAVVKHSFVDKQSLVRIHRTAQTDLKRIDW